MHAIADGDVARLSQLMASQKLTKPLLVLAARTGRLHVLKLLMDQARGQELLEAHAASAAIAAARSGHINVMELLWEEGFTGMLQASVSGTTPLHEAARCGRPEAARWLIAHKADCATFNNTSSNALHVAAAFGQTAVVQLLMQSDADIDLRDSRGASALILSTLRGHTETTAVLLQGRADISAHDVKGRTCSGPRHESRPFEQLRSQINHRAMQ